MLRRNLDFLALFVALAGMAAIQRVPRMEDRVSAKMIRYQDAMEAKQCAMQERVLSKIKLRQEAIEARECALQQRIFSQLKVNRVE